MRVMLPETVRYSVATLLLLSCVTAGAGGGTFQGKLVVEDFESFVWGEDWATVQFSRGADPRATAERGDVHSGEQACRLDVPPGETLTLVAQHGTRFIGKGDKPPLPLPGTPERIGLWARGSKSGHSLWLRLLDGAGKTAEVSLGTVDFEGWHLVMSRVPALAPPVGLRGLVVRGGSGPLVVDDVTVVTSASEPLYMTVKPLRAGEGLVEGQSARLRVILQSLAEKLIEGPGEVGALEVSRPDAIADRARFSYRVSAEEPFETTVRLRLDAGVYWAAAQAGKAGCGRRLAVFPRQPAASVRPVRAARRFGERGDALRVYESALWPAVAVETRERTLTLFRGLAEAGLSAPRDAWMRAKQGGMKDVRIHMVEPWILLWFGGAPEWYRVASADGSPCPTFDVPFLVVLDSVPEDVKVDKGLELTFAHRGERVALMPLCGVRRLSPTQTTRWRDDPSLMGTLGVACRAWAQVLRAMPVDVQEEWRIDAANDAVEVKVSFSYLQSGSRWGGRARRFAPVPPLLMLAKQAGLDVRFSREPAFLECYTSVGPLWAVADAEGYTCTFPGLLHCVTSAVADVPPGVPGAQVSLARNYAALSDDAAKIPFWTRYEGDEGRRATEALLAFMLSESNAHYAFDAPSGRMRAWDGLVWQQGEEAAAPAAAEQLRACWYAGLHAGLWEPSRVHWRQLVATRNVLAGAGDWATLGVGSKPHSVDARLNAEVFLARLAARLDQPQAYAESCARAVKLLAAAYALAAGAPQYAEQLAPWPGVPEGKERSTVFGGCRPGSVGLVPGPAPLVTSPSDAGYRFAAERLADYFRERFQGGPLDYFGRNAAEWKQRLFVTLATPELGGRFLPAPQAKGPYATNYVFSLETGPDGWPAPAWHTHRSPSGGPLIFGSIGTRQATRGKLERSETVSPWLRMSAWSAIEVLPPPKEPESPPPPEPEAPSSRPAADTPARSPR